MFHVEQPGLASYWAEKVPRETMEGLDIGNKKPRHAGFDETGWQLTKQRYICHTQEEPAQASQQ